MSFFTSRTGAKITGDSNSSFANNFPHLPDNTQACAMIKAFTQEEFQGELFYQVIWLLVDGDFKGATVKQRITPFDLNDTRAQRALNMMMRIMVFCEHPTEFHNPPSNADLAPMHGKILSIKIGNGIIQGEERTWVREVWKEGQLPTVTGETKVMTSKPSEPKPAINNEQSAFDRERQRKNTTDNVLTDDIPF